MIRNLNHLFLAGLLATLLVSCDKKEIAPETKAEPKHDENIVTLTKQNLEHVELKVEPVQLGNLGMTLQGGGPHQRELEQDGQSHHSLGRPVGQTQFRSQR